MRRREGRRSLNQNKIANVIYGSPLQYMNPQCCRLTAMSRLMAGGAWVVYGLASCERRREGGVDSISIPCMLLIICAACGGGGGVSCRPLHPPSLPFICKCAQSFLFKT